MPKCYCESHGCAGKLLKDRAFKDHQNEDTRRLLNQALNAADRAKKAEDDRLVAIVSELSLGSSDDATPGVLFAHSEDDIALTEPSVVSAGGTIPVSTESTFSDTLSRVKNDLRALTLRTKSQLESLSKPLKKSDPFPLTSALDEARELQGRTTRVLASGASAFSLKTQLTTDIATLVRQLDTARGSWKRQTERFKEPESLISRYSSDHHFAPILQGAEPLVQIMMFTMISLQVLLHLSRRGCHFLLAMTCFIIQLTLSRHKRELSLHDTQFVSQLPVDPASVTAKFPLDGQETIFAVCPNKHCHKLYLPQYSPELPKLPLYPKFCTHVALPGGSKCGTVMTIPRKIGTVTVQVAIKRYVSFSFKDFLANLLSRLGYEKMMDNPKTSSTDVMFDVHDAEFVKSFVGLDGKEFKSTLRVGRYMFSIGVDFFNPFGNKQAGKKCSVGIISMVCLSLPSSIRYRTENMFLAGVIPGPKEPPLTATNQYLSPLIDELLEFWDPGVNFSRTYDHPEGRLIQCALILVICDLLAARKVAGFAASSHEHFCSVCECCLKKPGLNDTNYHQWKFRTNESCRKAAERYRKADTTSARDSVFDSTGLRWSELLRLPYFDITRGVVVDSMHNLFLGLLKEHFSNILGVGLSVYREKPVLSLDLAVGADNSTLSENDRKGVKKLQVLLQAPSSTSLPTLDIAVHKLTQNVNAPALAFVCQIIQCPLPAPTKKIGKKTGKMTGNGLPYTKEQYARGLYEWRILQQEARYEGAETSTTRGHVLDLDDMSEIWSDLEAIRVPSWMTSVPHNLGNTSHGKLKADQWRALGTVHLPLSLIRIWGIPDPSNPRSSRCQKILDITISLLSAVMIATLRTTTVEHAEAYLTHITAYLNGIRALFPEYKLHPNHHLAVHIYDFLKLFGPVHSWWTFPFERLIGALQRMPSNFIIGELEETISRAYTRSSNLRAILDKFGCPEVIQKSRPIFETLVTPPTRDSLQTDINALTALFDDEPPPENSIGDRTIKKLPENLVHTLKRSRITVPSASYLRSNITIQGLTYSTSSKHLGNSNVLILASEKTIPARIEYIIQYEHNGTTVTRLGIQRHKKALVHYDPYLRYPVLGAQLWDVEMEDLEICDLCDVVSHFASLVIDKPYGGKPLIAILPLWRRIPSSSLSSSSV